MEPGQNQVYITTLLNEFKTSSFNVDTVNNNFFLHHCCMPRSVCRRNTSRQENVGIICIFAIGWSELENSMKLFCTGALKTL